MLRIPSENGQMTLVQLTLLIKQNEIIAQKFGLQLHREISGSKIICMLMQDGSIVFHQIYSNDYLHLLIATMHRDISQHLHTFEWKLKKAQMKQEREDLKAKKVMEQKTMYEQQHPDYNQTDIQ